MTSSNFRKAMTCAESTQRDKHRRRRPADELLLPSGRGIALPFGPMALLSSHQSALSARQST